MHCIDFCVYEYYLGAWLCSDRIACAVGACCFCLLWSERVRLLWGYFCLVTVLLLFIVCLRVRLRVWVGWWKILVSLRLLFCGCCGIVLTFNVWFLWVNWWVALGCAGFGYVWNVAVWRGVVALAFRLNAWVWFFVCCFRFCWGGCVVVLFFSCVCGCMTVWVDSFGGGLCFNIYVDDVFVWFLLLGVSLYDWLYM